MTTSDAAALLLAAAASALGAVVVAVMWRRRRRRRRALRSGHPSVRPPVRVELIDDGGSARIRMAVPLGAPPLTIDIVSYRRRDPTGPWEDEPLAEPLRLVAGTEHVLAASLGHDMSAVDVVVAWTVHGESGDEPGSQLFRLPPARDQPPMHAPAGLPGRAAAALTVLLLAAAALVVASVVDDDASGNAASDTPRSEGEPSAETATPTAPTTPSNEPSVTTTVTSIAETSTTETSTTTSEPVPTTLPSTSTTVTSSPNPPTDGPLVRAEGRIEPCRFGDECLVVGFTVVGFAGTPTEYVCEFDDGSRFTFTFVGDGADVACATGSTTASIIVEVDGIRSETVSRP